MKTIYKKKALCILLALALVFTLTPAIPGAVENAYAAEPGISITAATENTSGIGWSYDKDSKTLTLNGYDGGYIKLETSVTVKLEGTNTITVNESGIDTYGIDSRGTHGLTIDGTGSLTINVSANTRPAYGINNQIGVFTMSGGTVNITASSTSSQAYGVYGNAGVALEGGSLTANITGTSDGRGLYCKTGKLTVDSGAEVAVKVTNNGSNAMYGIYNEAYTASVTNNGDIELAGTVTITRDGGSTGSGNVYGIANGSSSSNTDGVISITGGSVTVTNAYYGIVAFTKGHDAAFEDVDISGGTVNVTSTTSDSLGIVSWNNGVTISGGKVTANTANKALWLADSDSDNKTGLVKITDDAKVSLTSTDYKALIVQGDESTSSTRVHQINLTSGGSVTVKSTSSEGSYYAFPVQGYFSLGSSTKITEGSLSSGTNAGGGRLFQADSTTNQVVVAYNTKLDKPTNLVWDGTTAKWDAVTDADKYRVILYASTSGSGTSTLIFNSDIAANSKDFSEYMLPGMYYSFEVAAYNSANQSGTFSGFDSSAKKQMPGSIGTVTGFAWSGNTISWTAVEDATGYDVWVVKDGVQKGSVRNISTANFDLTSDIENYGDGTYYVSVMAYKLGRGNYLAEGNSPAKIIGATPIYSAAVRNVSVNGTIGTAITETQVVIDLTNDTFVSALSGNWITNLPAGLSQSVSCGGTTMAIITISGTPTAASTEQIAITIPEDQLIVNTEDLTVTENANAKYSIAEPAKTEQTPTANNVTATFGETGKSVIITGLNETPTVSYAVQSGNDVVDVNAGTGALTIKKAGSATVRISFTETSTYAAGYKDVTVTVNKKSATTIAITGVNSSYDYTGSAIEPVPATVTADGTEMTSSDYQVTYGANKNAGASAGSITIKAKDTGNYTFTDYTANFTIAQIAANANINATVQATQNTVFGTGGFTQPTFKGLNNETVTGNVTYTISDTSKGATTVSDGDYNAAKASLATLAKDESVEVSWTFTPTGTTATNYYGTKTGDITITAKQSGGAGSGGGGGGGGGGGAAPATPQKPEIKPVTGGKVSLSADGTTATITPDAGKVVDKVLVNGKDMGAVTELKGLKTGDKIEVLFKDEVKEPSKAETDKQVKAHMQKLAPKARSLKTKAGNVKVSFEGQFKAIEALGYTVKYKFYRSTKKASGYKYRLTTSKPSYTNTGGKKGTLYYYKAIALAYDKDGKLIAKTELKQCRYACRRWSK